MCLGLPMTIIETDGISALCEFRGKRRRVWVFLLSRPIACAKVLVHVDTAIRLLDDEEAQLIGDAIEGIGAALNGEDCDRFFADLIDREPTLPVHLRLDQASGHLRLPNTSHETSTDLKKTTVKLEDDPVIHKIIVSRS
ncbi:HypC/HybG/HupF family hydrogenase formation chaperone [Bradyrhizobium arachidis]|nr:HypC/HybG/HupF family hydrogenase formation chaperone [Bradyrhizobium arachidis]